MPPISVPYFWLKVLPLLFLQNIFAPFDRFFALLDLWLMQRHYFEPLLDRIFLGQSVTKDTSKDTSTCKHHCIVPCGIFGGWYGLVRRGSVLCFGARLPRLLQV